MPAHTVFFLFALSFLSGIVFASLGLSLILSLIPAAIVCAALYVFETKARIALAAALLLVLGGLYFLHDDYRYRAEIAAVPASGEFQGLIVENPKRGQDYQSLYLNTSFGKMSIQTGPSHRYSYGDTLIVEGKTDPPTQNQYGRHIVATVRNPHITLVATGAGNPVLAYLLGIKEQVWTAYERLLAPDQAGLLYGIVFGANEHVPKQLAANLQTSGLRFLSAIDGLHMQILIFIIFGALAYLLPRKYAFLCTSIFVVLFIALTGFTVSGIRASVMALLAAIARGTGRMYVPHTILAFTALALALINPKTLVFDIGFQLSFLAVISIVYFLPVLRALARMSEDPGILGWKDSLLITVSVQLATAPVIISQFQSFSLSSFVASVAVVWMLPFILIFGLFLALASLAWYPLAAILSFLVAPMADYVILVVDAFARLAVLFNPNLGFIGCALYYGILVALMYWYYGRREQAPANAPTAPEVPHAIPAEAAEFEIIEIR